MLLFGEQGRKLSKHRNEFKTIGHFHQVQSKQINPPHLLCNYAQTVYLYHLQMSLQHLEILWPGTPRST